MDQKTYTALIKSVHGYILEIFQYFYRWTNNLLKSNIKKRKIKYLQIDASIK